MTTITEFLAWLEHNVEHLASVILGNGNEHMVLDAD
jgi:hypothetical protein